MRLQDDHKRVKIPFHYSYPSSMRSWHEWASGSFKSSVAQLQEGRGVTASIGTGFRSKVSGFFIPPIGCQVNPNAKSSAHNPASYSDVIL